VELPKSIVCDTKRLAETGLLRRVEAGDVYALLVAIRAAFRVAFRSRLDMSLEIIALHQRVAVLNRIDRLF